MIFEERVQIWDNFYDYGSHGCWWIDEYDEPSDKGEYMDDKFVNDILIMIKDKKYKYKELLNNIIRGYTGWSHEKKTNGLKHNHRKATLLKYLRNKDTLPEINNGENKETLGELSDIYILGIAYEQGWYNKEKNVFKALDCYEKIVIHFEENEEKYEDKKNVRRKFRHNIFVNFLKSVIRENVSKKNYWVVNFIYNKYEKYLLNMKNDMTFSDVCKIFSGNLKYHPLAYVHLILRKRHNGIYEKKLLKMINTFLL